MIRSRPAPASRANSASSAAKNGLDTPFEMDQKVSPEIGCTKAVTYNHLYRWGPSAIGRWPLGAHTRRRIGFRPMRCSSVAQTSIGVSGCWALASLNLNTVVWKRVLVQALTPTDAVVSIAREGSGRGDQGAPASRTLGGRAMRAALNSGP